MMLRAAFVPPTGAVDGLRALSSRLAALPGVHAVPAERIDVPITNFGNVQDRDADRLAAILEERLLLPALPTVGAAALELWPEGDLALRLSGDVDALGTVARAVGTAAERVHLYVDRRRFRPAVVVASADRQRPGSPLERMLSTGADLSALSTLAWEVAEVALLRTRWVAGHPRAEVAYRIGIATG